MPDVFMTQCPSVGTSLPLSVILRKARFTRVSQRAIMSDIIMRASWDK